MSPGITAGIIMGVGVFYYGIGAYGGWHQGYYDGQVDAITGTIKYELVKQKDGTTKWEEKK